MKVIKKAKLEAAFNKLSESADVFVPMQKSRQSGYYNWLGYDKDQDEIMLDVLNVYQPPKNVVFPQSSKMYGIKTNGVEISLDSAAETDRSSLIFGARACDVKGILAMDEVFLTRGYEDSFYKARRTGNTIVAHSCYSPGPNCFCNAMEVNPTDPIGADVIIRDAGDEYVWEAKSEKGEAVTAQIADWLEEKEVRVPESKSFDQHVDYHGVAEKLTKMFEHPLWDKISEPCSACGMCTYLCPSCYCFDIQVKMRGDEGYRFRAWDSCMYEEYSREAGGGNPRGLVKERFRNRFLHKLQFFTERYGTPLCTGCGRCMIVCPNGINIVKIIDAVKEAEIVE
ncbi:MAG TPA: 4Fe-4S dicluster domain-containing protein [Syntrophomonas sp.]|nr:4Fe-4S dicluster domain-containing protein [Syntrophomonas sp.]